MGEKTLTLLLPDRPMRDYSSAFSWQFWRWLYVGVIKAQLRSFTPGVFLRLVPRAIPLFFFNDGFPYDAVVCVLIVCRAPIESPRQWTCVWCPPWIPLSWDMWGNTKKVEIGASWRESAGRMDPSEAGSLLVGCCASPSHFVMQYIPKGRTTSNFLAPGFTPRVLSQGGSDTTYLWLALHALVMLDGPFSLFVWIFFIFLSSLDSDVGGGRCCSCQVGPWPVYQKQSAIGVIVIPTKRPLLWSVHRWVPSPPEVQRNCFSIFSLTR